MKGEGWLSSRIWMLPCFFATTPSVNHLLHGRKNIWAISASPRLCSTWATLISMNVWIQLCRESWSIWSCSFTSFRNEDAWILEITKGSILYSLYVLVMLVCLLRCHGISRVSSWVWVTKRFFENASLIKIWGNHDLDGITCNSCCKRNYRRCIIFK